MLRDSGGRMQEAGVRCLCSCMFLCLSEPAETEVCLQEAALIGWRRGTVTTQPGTTGGRGQGAEHLFFRGKTRQFSVSSLDQFGK